MSQSHAIQQVFSHLIICSIRPLATGMAGSAPSYCVVVFMHDSSLNCTAYQLYNWIRRLIFSEQIHCNYLSLCTGT